MFMGGGQGMPGFPVSFFMPQPHREPQQRPEIPPTRIRVALEVIHMLHYKEMDHGVPGDTPMCVDGKELHIEERETMFSALALLNTYFKGDYQASKEEKRIEKERKEKQSPPVKGPGMVLKCIGCGNRPHPLPNCLICKGTGDILVFSTLGDDGGEDED